jgi:hypothetical protein
MNSATASIHLELCARHRLMRRSQALVDAHITLKEPFDGFDGRFMVWNCTRATIDIAMLWACAFKRLLSRPVII